MAKSSSLLADLSAYNSLTQSHTSNISLASSLSNHIVVSELKSFKSDLLYSSDQLIFQQPNPPNFLRDPRDIKPSRLPSKTSTIRFHGLRNQWYRLFDFSGFTSQFSFKQTLQNAIRPSSGLDLVQSQVSINIRDPTAYRSNRIVLFKGQASTNNTSPNYTCSRTSISRTIRCPLKWISLCTLLTLSAILFSFFHLHGDPKHCRMSYMTPSFTRLASFDTSPLASKYSLYLYHEHQVDTAFDCSGIPVLFIPGNAGSFRQVRALASASSVMHHSIALSPKANTSKSQNEDIKFDYFTADFQEDLTAFHGRALHDQAEYLNEAVLYILSLYSLCNDDTQIKSHTGLSHFPKPKSVILVGHSMGGIVARAMVTIPNYQKGSVNTIFTLSAPHGLPPFSCDEGIVKSYHQIEKYWEHSFNKSFNGTNPLASISVISVAGGSLDTTISSESTSVSSSVPASNGFTVFSNSIPHVWSGIDHQAIVWCDQFRNVFAAALREIVDISVPAKTKSLPERMSIFRKRFLGGFEKGVSESYLEKNARHSHRGAEKVINKNLSLSALSDSDTVIRLEDKAKAITTSTQRLSVENHGTNSEIYFLPIPPHGISKNMSFSLLTNGYLVPEPIDELDEIFVRGSKSDRDESRTGVYVLACRYPHIRATPSSSSTNLFNSITLEYNEAKSVKFQCKNIASNAFKMPHHDIRHGYHSPPGNSDYSSFLQYNVSQLINYDLIAIVDNSDAPTLRFINAEYSGYRNVTVTNPLIDFLKGVSVTLSGSRPMMVDISYTSVWSSLLAFRARVVENDLKDVRKRMFTNFIRQYSGHNYDSKYFLNLRNSSRLNITISGVAPFLPFKVKESDGPEGSLFYNSQGAYYHNLHLQVWSDASVAKEIRVILELDIPGSLGKLVMHYRAALSVFPAAIIGMVLIIQLRVLAASGCFISLTDGLNMFVSHQLLPVLAVVAIIPIVLSWPVAIYFLTFIEPDMNYMASYEKYGVFTDIRRNQFFLGLESSHLWFLGPVFIFLSIGVCYITSHVISFVIQILGFGFSGIKYLFFYRHFAGNNQQTRSQISIAEELTTSKLSLREALKEIAIGLLTLVAFLFVPCEFAFIVACLVQIATAIGAHTFLKNCPSSKALRAESFYNMAFSILMFMVFLLPIAVPVVVVWIRGISINRSFSFQNIHNSQSAILIFMCARLMEADYELLGPVSKPQCLLTELCIGFITFYALIFGITRAFMLCHLFSYFLASLGFLYTSNRPSLKDDFNFISTP